jgi:hypothetical protein
MSTDSTKAATTALTPEQEAHNALAKVQAHLKARKDKENKFGGYSYRNKEGIFEAVKPLLAAHGATITITDDVEFIQGRFYVMAEAKFTAHGYTIIARGYARECDTKKGMDEAQITGAASSYAGKYALCNLLAIDDSANDPDADNDHGKRLPTLAELTRIMQAESEDTLRSLFTQLRRNNVATGYLTDLCRERQAEISKVSN